MVQDISPHQLNIQYASRPPAAEDLVICCSGRRMLVSEGERLRFPTVAQCGDPEALIYLFSVDGQAFYLLQAERELPGFRWVPMGAIRQLQQEPKEMVFAAFTALHLAEWYRRKRYCGACGAPLAHDETERAMTCPSCGEKYYPRINPAVIVGVINGDRLLITRYRNGPGISALIAGFVEIGETLEDTVRREVMEEAGIRVKHIRYYKSQPWGIASDLLAGFFCEVEGDDTIRMDTGELRYAQWVPREEILLQPTDHSLTNEMMRRFQHGEIETLAWTAPA